MESHYFFQECLMGHWLLGGGRKEYRESDELGERGLKRRLVIKGSKCRCEMEWGLVM